MGWFERIISLNGRLTGAERSNRRLIFTVSLVHTVNSCVFGLAAEPQWPLLRVCIWTALAMNMSVLLCCLCNIYISKMFAKVAICLWGVTSLMVDYNMRTIGSQPAWPLIVLLADMALLMRLGRQFTAGLITLTSGWIVLTCMESVFRFGFFDAPGSAPTWYRWQRLQDTVTCTIPPCPASLLKSTYETGLTLIVLITDFFATRWFSAEVDREQATMERTIQTLGDIATLLSRYDVDTVAQMLQHAEGLPVPIYEALCLLEANLRAYRPYLPKSCLPDTHARDDAVSTDSGSNSRPARSEGSSYPSIVPPVGDSAGGNRCLGVLKPHKGTVVVLNTCGTLQRLAGDAHAFAVVFQELLAHTIAAVEAKRGIVDTFIGGRITASFNTSRTCFTHATAALHAVKSVLKAMGTKETHTQVQLSIGVATGNVLCGDMGCADMRRFTLLGELPLLGCGMERASRAFGIYVVCNKANALDAEHEHVLLLLPCLVQLVKVSTKGMSTLHPALDNINEQYVYEMDTTTQSMEDTGMEWLYDLSRRTRLWEPYNKAMSAFLQGSGVEDAVSIAEEHSERVRLTISLIGRKSPLVVHV